MASATPLHTCWSSSFSACTVPSSRQASELVGLVCTSASRARAASVSTPRLWECKGCVNKSVDESVNENVLQSMGHKPSVCEIICVNW